MKVLLLIFLLFPVICFSQTKIEVHEGAVLVASDSGVGITVETLRAKMLNKGIDISDVKYTISSQDITVEVERRRTIRQRQKNRSRDLRNEDCSLHTGTGVLAVYIKKLCQAFSSK